MYTLSAKLKLHKSQDKLVGSRRRSALPMYPQQKGGTFMKELPIPMLIDGLGAR